MNLFLAKTMKLGEGKNEISIMNTSVGLESICQKIVRVVNVVVIFPIILLQTTDDHFVILDVSARRGFLVTTYVTQFFCGSANEPKASLRLLHAFVRRY